MRPEHFPLSHAQLRDHQEEGFVRPARISDLLPGTEVRAIKATGLVHAGPVTDVLPGLELIWIFDEQSRTRKIIESREFTIVARMAAQDTITPKDEP